MALLIPGIIIAIAAMVLLVIAVAGKAQETSTGGQALPEARETIRSELVEAREYLSRLEDVIAGSWNVLTQDHVSGEYDETRITSQYEIITEKLAQMNEETDRYIKENESLDAETKRILVTIAGTLLSTREDLDRAYDEYKKAIAAAGKTNQDNEAALKSLLGVLASDAEKANGNLTELLNENGKDIEKASHLLELLTELVNEDIGNLKQSIEAESARLGKRLAEKVARLTSDLAAIMVQSDQAKDEISGILNVMDAAYETRSGEIADALNGINHIMLAISADYARAHEEVKEICREFSESAYGRQNELLDALKRMSDDMETDNDSLNQHFRDLGNDLSAKISVNEDILALILKMEGELDKNFSSLFQSFADGKGLLAAALANKGETVAPDADFASFAAAIMNLSPDSTIIDLDGRLREAEAALITNLLYADSEMAKMKSELETKIELIVQAVVNGKELLVSALRAKEQAIDDEPSFVDLYNAIMTIETGILSGDIVHTYHFHTTVDDGDVTAEDTHSLNAAANSVRGGCFRDSIPHTHQGNTVNGGDCYGSIAHTHGADCYVAYVFGGSEYVCSICSKVYRGWAVPADACHYGYPFHRVDGFCANCGQFAASHQFGGSRCRTLTCGIHPFALSCEKTIDGYAAECGYLYNQITGAVIIY